MSVPSNGLSCWLWGWVKWRPLMCQRIRTLLCAAVGTASQKCVMCAVDLECVEEWLSWTEHTLDSNKFFTFSFHLSLYIFIFWSFFAFEVKVGVPEFFICNAESKCFSEHRRVTVSVYHNTHLQNYAVGFFAKSGILLMLWKMFV
jgi:hypothetical protein